MAIVAVKDRARRAAQAAARGSAEQPNGAPSVISVAPEPQRSSVGVTPSAQPLPVDLVSIAADGDDPEPAYDIGFGRPPRASQFRKGDGRPRGPAKGSRRLKSLDAIYGKELSTLVQVRIQGRTRKVSRAEALVLLQLDKAAKGDYRSLRDVLAHVAANFPREEVTKAIKADLTATDLATLAAYRDEIEAELSRK